MKNLCKNRGSCFDKLMGSSDACRGEDICKLRVFFTDFYIIAQPRLRSGALSNIGLYSNNANGMPLSLT